MPDEAAAAPATAPTSWPMTAQEARDLTVEQLNLDQLKARINIIGTAFAKRVGLPDGTNVRYHMDECMWRRNDGPVALPRADEANGPTEK